MDATPASAVNQLVMVTVSGPSAGELIGRLTRDGFYVTQMDSRGGVLDEAHTSLLIGLDQPRLGQLLDHVRECCRTRRQFIPAQVADALPLPAQPVMIEAEVGGAVLYVLDVERFEQL